MTKFNFIMRYKPIQFLLDVLCTERATAETVDEILELIQGLHWCLSNHPDVVAEDPVSTLLDSDVWVEKPAFNEIDRQRCRELRELLLTAIDNPTAIAPPAHTFSETLDDVSSSEVSHVSSKHSPPSVVYSASAVESKTTATPETSACSPPSVRSKFVAPVRPFNRAQATMLAFGFVSLLSGVYSLAVALYLDRCDSARK